MNLVAMNAIVLHSVILILLCGAAAGNVHEAKEFNDGLLGEVIDPIQNRVGPEMLLAKQKYLRSHENLIVDKMLPQSIVFAPLPIPFPINSTTIVPTSPIVTMPAAGTSLPAIPKIPAIPSSPTDSSIPQMPALPGTGLPPLSSLPSIPTLQATLPPDVPSKLVIPPVPPTFAIPASPTDSSIPQMPALPDTGLPPLSSLPSIPTAQGNQRGFGKGN